jgi:hypothetical protein
MEVKVAAESYHILRTPNEKIEFTSRWWSRLLQVQPATMPDVLDYFLFCAASVKIAKMM